MMMRDHSMNAVPARTISAIPRIVVLVLTLALCIVASGQQVLSSQGVSHTIQRSGDTKPEWTASFPMLTASPDHWQQAKPAFSYDGKCIAIAGNGEAVVVSNTGRTLWKWHFGRINRFLVAGSVAVSPTCDAIAMGGDSSYKYVWIADRKGHAVSVAFKSTPFGIVFDRTGQSVAVGTGAGRMFLYHRDGKEVWDTPPYTLFLPFTMEFSPDNHLLLVRDAAAILRPDGSIVAKFGGGAMSISRDLQTVVTSAYPPHGPGPGSVSVSEQSGKFVWNQFSEDPGGVITPAGDKIMARVNIDQDIPPPDAPYEPRETTLKLFDRVGKELKEFEDIDGRPIDVSPDGMTFLLETAHSLEAIDIEGKRLYSIPDGVSTYVIASDFSAVVVYSRGSDGDFEYFKLK